MTSISQPDKPFLFLGGGGVGCGFLIPSWYSLDIVLLRN